MNAKNIVVTITLLLIVGGVSFYAGMGYGRSQLSGTGRQFFINRDGQALRNGTNGGMTRGNFRPVAGEIISADDKSITVKLQDGSSRIVFLAGNTAINKADQATKADLKVGQTVAVFGQQNSDGSVTAQTIQLNPLNSATRGGTSTGSAQTQ